ASKSIEKVLSIVTAAVIEGNSNRTSDKETETTAEEVTAPAAEATTEEK
ncbi:MAG: 30S ribosomal protein S2, partial [Flavobacterium sp.]